ncbi:winged helix-turn-helix transcriptional regulator [Paenibacillus sp. 2TAB19]|uniref:winged helix-turn-helix transcriptional regulator n=1 Tax=Paenibacillus sp. 2TAB19 TaxID=3233003 RepID=UPI003F999BCB
MKIQPELCKVEDALSIIVGKWKTSILLHLISTGTMRYGEIKKAMGTITPKMLTTQLKELEEEGIIQRVVFPQVPPKVEYSMTEYGMTLEPILTALHNWSAAHPSHKARTNSTQTTNQ